jgi:hypothetical protein
MKFKNLLSKNSKEVEEESKKIEAERAANRANARMIVYKTWNKKCRDALQKDEAELNTLRQTIARIFEYETLDFFKTSEYYEQVSSKLTGLKDHLQERLASQMEKIANTIYFTAAINVYSDDEEAKFVAKLSEGDLIDIVPFHDKEKMAKYDKYLRPEIVDDTEDWVNICEVETGLTYGVPAKQFYGPIAGKRPTLKKEEVE